MSQEEAKPFNYGGQAVIEGVMMRGSRTVSVAVRNPDGNIVIHTEPLNPKVYNGRLIKIPFLRGLVGLWDALGLGMKALMFSADIALEEEGDGETSEAFSGPAQWATVALSLSMSIGLFFVLPAFLAGLVENWLGGPNAEVISHIVEGVIRLTLLVGYVVLIGRMEDVKRLYGYHGAEHKTINAFEAGAELSPRSIARFPLEHPRCGTAFLLSVVVISIILFTLLPEFTALENAIGAIGTRVVTRIVLVPFVAGIAYEYLRFTAKYKDNLIIRWLIKPNLALQRLTTREPDLTMIEVALAAFERVLESERDLTAAAVESTIVVPQPTD